MIPPSVPLVIYAILTQESIGKLFMAAVLPGLIAMVGYMIVVRILVTWRPAMGPAGARVAWPERLKSSTVTGRQGLRFKSRRPSAAISLSAARPSGADDR